MADSSLTLVVGLGKTGHSIAGFLQRRNRPFVMFDTRKEAPGVADFQQSFPGVDVYLQQLPDTLFSKLSGVIASPGVSLDNSVMEQLIAHNLPIIGDIECLAQEISVPVVAITGTNGKSTVTTLVGEMAIHAGKNVAVAGNIGLPVLDRLDQDKYIAMWVLELSSFQLDLTYQLSPLVATILNVSPDHLDRHLDMPAYIASKQRIYHQAKTCLFNRDDMITTPSFAKHQISFGLGIPEEGQWGIIEKNGSSFLAFGRECFLPVDELKIKGKHNWQNALAAAALARLSGIPDASIIAVLSQFQGLSHRCQWVRTLDGVAYINDSKGTNVGAAESAIAGIGDAIAGQIVLIAGGLGKGANFMTLQESVKAHVRALVLIGQDAPELDKALSPVVKTFQANSLDEAVIIARSKALSGDVVLLSPACASQDMFRDFNHRGEVFIQLVNQL